MTHNDDVLIVSGARTPIGTFAGALKDVPADQLGAIAVREAIGRAGIAPGDIDEVILGNVLQAGLGLNPARKVQIASGVPEAAPSFTVNKACGSGLKAVALAAQSIALGDARTVVAGGMESMNGAPYLLQKARSGYRLGHGELVDALLHDGLTCPIEHVHMGITAENLAADYGVSREEQDRYAALSHRRAVAATNAGRFRDEIVSVPVPTRKGEPLMVDQDEHPRPDTHEEALARLRPAFKGDGTVTAGNASGINDGAAALVLMARTQAEDLGAQPLAVYRGHASVGVSPRVMGIGPAPAIQKLLGKLGWSLGDVDLFEINEAFAAQTLAVLRELGLDAEKVNVNGGAIALGHPIGASGARILVTLIYEMTRRNAKRGIAALCIGGGQGIALAVERTGL